MSVPNHVLRVADEIKGLSPERALLVIQDRLISPSAYDLAYLSAIVKEGRPDLSYQSIFEGLGYNPGRLKSVISALNDYREVLSGSKGRRVTLGYHPVDRLTRGIRPGQVMGIMARAGVGKTALAVNIMANIFRRVDPHGVLFFSLEMPAGEVVARLFTVDNRETPERLDSYLEKAQGDPRLAAWSRRYQELVIVDESGLSISDVEKGFREAEKYLGKSVPLLIIDYLGLLRASGGSSYERMSNLARELKSAAKRLSCALLVLIQTSRQGGSGGDPLSLCMARDSGAIEEACDFLLGAWRPELNGGGRPGELVLSLLKNRHGMTGEFSFHFDKETLRISGGHGGEPAG
ncbi:MAG: DnaB-like helicase C-terminal domain-containing protein [Actinomycetota bacterium]|nr:DnaB-like helicase C-terminal domain-containing protein [Actinomycetota bacterium]